MFNVKTLQSHDREVISGGMKQNSSPTVQHEGSLNQIREVQVGPVVYALLQRADNEDVKTSQAGTLFMDNLLEVKHDPSAEPSSSHSGQSKVGRKRTYDPAFVNKVKQELSTHKVAQVAKKYGLPYKTVYGWRVKLFGSRRKVGRKRIYDPASINKVKQELSTHTISQVAKKYTIPYPTVCKWRAARSDGKPKVGYIRKYGTEFVNKIKQKLLTYTIEHVVKEDGIPFSIVKRWWDVLDDPRKYVVRCSDARKVITRRNAIEMAKQTRFRSLEALKRHCVDRVNDLCSQQQNHGNISKTEIICRVAKEEGIYIQTLMSWVVHDGNDSSGSRSVFLLPMKTPHNKHSVKKAQPHQTVSGNSDAQQLKAGSHIHSVKPQGNKPSTAPPTVRTDSTYAEKIEKGFAKCFQHIQSWLNK